jgi:dephospho-CoA kinase
MTKIIGLTGGIGSGKTTVAKYLIAKGIPVFISDDEAKKTLTIPEVKDKLKSIFDDKIFNGDVIDKVALAKLVFNDATKLSILNHIIHPLVKQNFNIWKKNNSNAPIIVKESAILFETDSYKDCDFIITITAPVQERIQRVVVRDSISKEAVIERMDKQWTDEMKCEKSDFVLENNTIDETLKKIDEILKKITIQ